MFLKFLLRILKTLGPVFCVFLSLGKYIFINMQLIMTYPFQVKRHCFRGCSFLCIKDEKAFTCLFVCVRVYMCEYACVSICMCVDPLSVFSV